MNASFPDYDFSSIKPEQFTHHPLSMVVSHINTHLQRATEAGDKLLLKEFWAALSESVELKNCEVYSYVPEEDGPFGEESSLWTLNYFFYNKALKRLVFFICSARSKHLSTMKDASQYGVDESSAAMDEDEEEASVDIFSDMLARQLIHEGSRVCIPEHVCVCVCVCERVIPIAHTAVMFRILIVAHSTTGSGSQEYHNASEGGLFETGS